MWTFTECAAPRSEQGITAYQNCGAAGSGVTVVLQGASWELFAPVACLSSLLQSAARASDVGQSSVHCSALAPSDCKQRRFCQAALLKG